jgi:hypothetical protein
MGVDWHRLAHRSGPPHSLGLTVWCIRALARTKGGLNSKPHALCDGNGRPLVMLLSEGQMSDYKGRGADAARHA